MIDSSTTTTTAAAAVSEITHDVYTLHAGDALTGSLFYTAYGPKIDATWMNAANVFDVMVLGNHEFDEVGRFFFRVYCLHRSVFRVYCLHRKRNIKTHLLYCFFGCDRVKRFLLTLLKCWMCQLSPIIVSVSYLRV
jgi:hypothetical protein